MKLVVHGDSLGPGQERMRRAIQGLEHRGHQVRWRGRGTRDAAHSRGALPRGRADLVLGGDRPVPVAWLGWLVGAHGMVLSLLAGSRARWSFLERWCWHSLDSRAFEESGGAASPIADGEADTGRVLRWPSDSGEERDTETLERACERMLARGQGGVARPAVFLDRDGTLVVEKGYAAGAASMELLPGVPQALRNLRAAGFAIVVISNQSGVGRGLFPESAVHEAMGALRTRLRAHGVEIDAVYFCPHRPDAACDCRKPRPGMLRRAAQDLHLSLKDSVMIGDKRIDVETAREAGALGVLVRTGYGRAEEVEWARAGEGTPARVAEDLAEAARWLLAREP